MAKDLDVRSFVDTRYSTLFNISREAEKKGMSHLQIGLVFSTFELVMFLFCPLYGIFLTRIGAKFMYVTGILVGGVCNILFG